MDAQLGFRGGDSSGGSGGKGGSNEEGDSDRVLASPHNGSFDNSGTDSDGDMLDAGGDGKGPENAARAPSPPRHPPSPPKKPGYMRSIGYVKAPSKIPVPSGAKKRPYSRATTPHTPSKKDDGLSTRKKIVASKVTEQIQGDGPGARGTPTPQSRGGRGRGGRGRGGRGGVAGGRDYGSVRGKRA